MRDDAERKVELAAAKNREAKLLRKTAYVIAQEAGRLPFRTAHRSA